MADDDLAVVFDACDPAQEALYAAMLKEAGITVIGPSLEMLGDSGIYGRRLCHQLLVPQAEAEEARKLVEAYREAVERGEFAIDDLPAEGMGEGESGP